MYRVTERTRDGLERTVLDTQSPDTCARFFCALVGRSTFTVLASGPRNALPRFVERPAVRVVLRAIDARYNRPATFTASAAGCMYTARYYCQPRTAQSVPGYPRGLIDLTRLTGRDLPSVEPGRSW